jgi:hypothetical protein
LEHLLQAAGQRAQRAQGFCDFIQEIEIVHKSLSTGPSRQIYGNFIPFSYDLQQNGNMNLRNCDQIRDLRDHPGPDSGPSLDTFLIFGYF